MKVRVMNTKAVSKIARDKNMPDYDPERRKTARKWAGNNRVACMLLLGFNPHCCAEHRLSWDHLWKCFTKQVPPEMMLFLEEISGLEVWSKCGCFFAWLSTVQPEICSKAMWFLRRKRVRTFFRPSGLPTQRFGEPIQNGRWLERLRWWWWWWVGLWGWTDWMVRQLPAGMHSFAIHRWQSYSVCMARLHPSLCQNGLASCERRPFSDNRIWSACCLPADAENGRLLDCNSFCNDLPVL